MEILIPENIKKQVNVVRQIQESYLVQFRSALDKVIPVGYTLSIEDSKNLRVFKTPENKEDLKWSWRRDDLISNLSEEIVISSKATAQDIYNLCGLLQMLTEVDIKLLGNFIISK